MFAKRVAFLVLVAGLCLAQDSTVEPDTSIAPETTTPAAATTAATTTLPKTTTPAPETTTTEAPATTTPAPATTTPAPATTTPPSPHDEFYRHTEDNVTCVMFAGDFTLNVVYNTTKGTSREAEIKLPAPSSNPSVLGLCGPTNGTSWIQVQWGVANQSTTMFHLEFTSIADQWELSAVQMAIQMSSDVFVDSPDAGKTLYVMGSLPDLSAVQVPVNSSLSCRGNVESSNFNGTVAGSEQVYTVTADALGFKLQAFNAVPHVTSLQSGPHCSADAMSDIVPIAVGCALAALVLLVLVSYLVGRRRRAAAYQSV